MVRAGHLPREKELCSEESFYFHLLDDTPPEDAIPLAFPELDQQLQVRIYPVFPFVLLSFTRYRECTRGLTEKRLTRRQSGDVSSHQGLHV